MVGWLGIKTYSKLRFLVVLAVILVIPSFTLAFGFLNNLYISYPGLANEIIIENDPIPAPPEDPREYLWFVVEYDEEIFDLADRIITSESGWQIDVKNASSSASGLFQFIDGTFNDFCIDLYGFANDMSQKNNPYIQINCALQMIYDGGLSHWNASKHLWNR